MKKLLLIFCLFLISISYSQIKIQTIDFETGKVVKATKIYSLSNELLGETDNEGYYSLPSEQNKIVLKADGYSDKTEPIGREDKTVFLFPKDKENSKILNEVVVTAKDDPKALRLLRLMWKNLKNNHPDYLGNYQFSSYTKFAMDANSDSVKLIKNPKDISDSIENAFKKTLKKNMLFIGERAMEHKYDSKLGRKNLVVATQTSGMKTPIYEALGAQLLINELPSSLKEENYKYYRYKLLDSLEINDRKTYKLGYVMRSKYSKDYSKSATFYIDAESFALVKFLGEVSGSYNSYFEIEWEKYKNIWYTKNELVKIQMYSTPKEEEKKEEENSATKSKNTQKRENQKSKSKTKNKKEEEKTQEEQVESIKPWVTILTYFSKFTSPVEFNKKDFSGYEYEIAPEITKNADEKISGYRDQQLTEREKLTYVNIDSLSQKFKLERKLKWLMALTKGELEVGKVNLDLFNFLKYNDYEGFRFQIGGKTNYKFSEKFSLHGYAAWATKDNNFKGNLGTDFFVNRKNSGKISLDVFSDVAPSGRNPIRDMSSKEDLRRQINNLYNADYYSYRKASVSYQQDFFKNITINLIVDYQTQLSDFDYAYKNNQPRTWYNLAETSLRIKYAPFAKYMATPSGKVTLEDKYPYFFFNYTKNWKVFDADFNSDKIDFSTIYGFSTKLGYTNTSLNAGKIMGNTTLMNLYEGMGNAKKGDNTWKRFGVGGINTFETMNVGSFYSDQYISFNLQHYFTRIHLFGQKYLYPKIIYNALIGNMHKPEIHSLHNFSVPDKLYQEVGFELRKLILSNFGIGTYYRFGTYNSGKFEDNFYVKATLDLNF